MKRLVLAVDGSPSSIMASHWAASLASVANAAVTILRMDPSAQSPDHESSSPSVQTDTTDCISPLEGAGVAYDTRSAVGDAPTKILDVAAEVAADIIIIGRRPHTLVRPRLLGAVTRRLLRNTVVPVVIVPPPVEHPARERITPTVIAGIDRSAGSRSVLDWTLKLGRYLDLESEFISILDLNERASADGGPPDGMGRRPEPPIWFRELLAGVDPNRRARITAHTEVGVPTEELLRRSNLAEMLVLGTWRQSSVDLLLDQSTSHYCAAHAGCPVVLVPLDTAPQSE